MLEQLLNSSGSAPIFQGMATLLSAGAAVVVGTLGFRQSVKVQKEKHTLDVMLHLLTNDKFTRANWLVMQHAERGVIVDPTNITQEEDALFTALLSMYEFISISFLSDKMDRQIILRQRRSGLAKTHQILSDYITYKRRVWDRPTAYRSFETVVKVHIFNDEKRSTGAPQAAAGAGMSSALETR